MADKRRGRRLLAGLCMTGLIGVFLAWPGVNVIRQERLNRGLIIKVREGDLAGVARQLARGADPNARDYGDRRMTPRQLLDTLLRSTTLRRTPQASRPTALLLAVQSSHPEIFHALLQAGARTEERDAEGRTALIISARWLNAYDGSSRNMQMLLDAGADSNAVDAVGNSSLMDAAMCGRAQEVKTLFAHGADPNQKTHFGRTALMLVASSHSPRIVKILLQNHADVNLRDNEGRSALMYALGNGVPNYLSPASVVWNPLPRQGTRYYDGQGREYAIGAAKPEEHDTVALLLQAGADPNTRDNKNVTALQQANRMGYPDLIALLKQAGAKP